MSFILAYVCELQAVSEGATTFRRMILGQMTLGRLVLSGMT